MMYSSLRDDRRIPGLQGYCASEQCSVLGLEGRLEKEYIARKNALISLES